MDRQRAAFVGWDGGGTKTAVCAMRGDGTVLWEDQLGPLNPNGAPAETVRETIRAGLRLMAERLPEGCAGLCVGMAGVSSAGAARLVEETIREGYAGPLRLAGDQEIALSGAVEGPGAVLIAGTGSVCYGRDAAGDIHRTGGCGYLIDDGGSGYAIGRDLLACAARDWDGRACAPLLRKAVFDALGVRDLSGLITWLYAPATGKKEIAALAPLLLPALEAGERAAEDIADRAAAELFGLADTLWRKAGLTAGELALTGGVLQRYPPVREALEKRLLRAHPEMRVISPRHSAAWGAARMAAQG